MFFGNHQLSEIMLKQVYSYSYFLNQVHGNQVIKAQSVSQEADGHFSPQSHCPLVIRTADCLPLFFLCGDQVVALHAGWRGVKKKILTRSLACLEKQKLSELWIGPHIQNKSFELDQENLFSLLKAHKISMDEAHKKNIISLSVKRAKHFCVSLAEIIRWEALNLGFKKVNISPIDTYTSTQHFSYRRNPYQKKRNLSFIIKH